MKIKIIADRKAKSDEPIYEYCSFGGYTIIHITDFRNAWIKKYGQDSCSEIQMEDKHSIFEYEAELDTDWYKELNVPQSHPSVSSSSITYVKDHPFKKFLKTNWK